MRRILLALCCLALLAAAPSDPFELTPAPGWVECSPHLFKSQLFPDDRESVGLFSVEILEHTTVADWAHGVREQFRFGKLMQEDDSPRGHRILGSIATHLQNEDLEAAHFWLGIAGPQGRLYVLHGIATQPNFDRHWEDIFAMARSFRFPDGGEDGNLTSR